VVHPLTTVTAVRPLPAPTGGHTTGPDGGRTGEPAAGSATRDTSRPAADRTGDPDGSATGPTGQPAAHPAGRPVAGYAVDTVRTDHPRRARRFPAEQVGFAAGTDNTQGPPPRRRGTG